MNRLKSVLLSVACEVRHKQGGLLLPLLVYIVLDVLANAIGQGRKIKDIRNE